MRFVFASYVYTPAFNSPAAWIDRIKAYTGILEALAKNNQVISIEQIDYEGEYRKDGVEYLFKRFSKNELRFPLRLHQFIKSQKPDVVIIQSLHFPLQVIQLRLLLGRKVKIIVQNHAEKPFIGLKKYAQKLADKYIDAYLFASYEMGAEWVEKGNIASVKKIYEVMEVSSVFTPIHKVIARQKTNTHGGPLFLWVGRLNANKDPLTIVKAFLKYAVINPAAHLYMIYHTDELFIFMQQIINASPQKDAITLVGKVPHSELQYWFNSADIIIAGSYYEGSGTAVCEAMSCACMPIVTDIFSFRMITDNGRCGLLFEPGDEVELLSALKQSEEMNIKEKQEISLEYFRSNLSFEAIAGKIEDIARAL
jgi:glycosyltransferase involved in cell wall biosynthesis